MTQETAAKLEKVQRYSQSLKQLFKFLFVVAALALAVRALVFVTGAGPYATTVRVGAIEYSAATLPTALRLYAFVAFVLGSGLTLKLFFHLIKLFGLYADGRIFTAENVRQIRQVGVTVLLVPVIWVMGLFAPLLVSGERLTGAISGASLDPLTEIVVGAIIIVIAWIMDVGRELREEQDLVV